METDFVISSDFEKKKVVCLKKTRLKVTCGKEATGVFPDDQPQDWIKGYRYTSCTVNNKCKFKRGF